MIDDPRAQTPRVDPRREGLQSQLQGAQPEPTANTGSAEDPDSPAHIDGVTLQLVADPAHLTVPASTADEAELSRWVLCVQPLARLASSTERSRAEKVIDGTGRILAAKVLDGSIGDLSARWLLVGMMNQAGIAQSAAQAWLLNNRRGHGTGDAEELSDLVRDELTKTIIGEDGDPARAAWQWDRIASSCGWARKIAMKAAAQRKDKLGERNRVRLYGSSEDDRRAVFGTDPHAVVPINPDGVELGDYRDNPAGALRIRQHLEFQQLAARLVARSVGIPDAPRIPGPVRSEAAEVLAGSSPVDVQRVLRAVSDGRARPQQTEQGLLYDMWAAATPQVREALLTVQDPRLCVAWAQGQVAPRPRHSAAIISRVSASIKELMPTRRWRAISGALAEAYAESVSELPNELARSAFHAATEKTDARLVADRRDLLAMAQDAIDLWAGGDCPLGSTPEQIEDSLRDRFNDVIDFLADERARNIS